MQVWVLLAVIGTPVPITYLIGTILANKKREKKYRLQDARRNRYLVFMVCAWVVWGVSFFAALMVMYNYLSRGPTLLVHLGATLICSLFAEVFMISALSLRSAIASYTVIVLGSFLAILGGILVSMIEFLPDDTSKIVYTALAGLSILIGVTNTHGLGGWITHIGNKEDAEQEWSFWQPGKGGSVFITAQFFGWLLFGVSLLCLAWMGKIALTSIAWCGSICFRSLSISTALVMICAQLILAGSLILFKRDEKGRTKEVKGGAAVSPQVKPVTWKTFATEWVVLITLYCPHFLVFLSIVGPYMVFPHLYVSSTIMGIMLPLHLLFAIGLPQSTGTREWPAFKAWISSNLDGVCYRFFGGVQYICEHEGGYEDGKKYIFAYHPHALYPVGVIIFHLMPRFKKYFGSLKPVTLIASIIFKVPMLRELTCWAGCREVSGRVFRQALNERGAVALIPGGQAELCEAPKAHVKDNPQIVLNTRHKGFIRIAHETGSSIIPVICFGEIYQLKNCISMPRLQSWTYKQLGFPIPFIPVGMYGLPIPLPLQSGQPFTFVIGKALQVKKIEGGVSDEQLQATHALYYQKVQALYEKYKSVAGYEDKQLVLSHETFKKDN